MLHTSPLRLLSDCYIIFYLSYSVFNLQFHFSTEKLFLCHYSDFKWKFSSGAKLVKNRILNLFSSGYLQSSVLLGLHVPCGKRSCLSWETIQSNIFQGEKSHVMLAVASNDLVLRNEALTSLVCCGFCFLASQLNNALFYSPARGTIRGLTEVRECDVVLHKQRHLKF